MHAIPSFQGGGAERQLSLLAPALSRLGVDTHVVYVRPGVNLYTLQHSAVHLHPIDHANFHDPKILWRLLRLVRTVRPDLIQTWLPQMDVFAGIAARLSGTPYMLTERSSAQAYATGWKNRLRRGIGLAANAVVANSQGGIAYWGERAGARFVIRNGIVSPKDVPAAPLNPDFPAPVKVILFAGRLQFEKNVSTLVAALDTVLALRPDCVAVLFGEGSLREALHQQVGKLPTGGRIHLAGYSTQVAAWMRRATVLVSVSHFEGSPNTVLEAMSVGCPLVVSDIPQHREILDDSSAAFCDPTDARSIARVLGEVLQHPAASKERSIRAAARAREFSIENAAQEYLRVYRSLVRRQPLSNPSHAR